ncbi:interleukin-18 receptor accessory protein-like isoform X1 [Phyllopteryx taeniolatus]|uniref:interleukin-18 receptor accessory protein-like isoform X1 n=1 Tax=Phyllopteryx taeniolatus TaxID=161469 RepID=UPI002AD2B8CC|nr:interleukin-18 receptor accessory protein-like isoform X1 [Phyllopteryx taeniolatus]
MPAGCMLLFWVVLFPVCLEGCCVKGSQRNRKGPRMNTTQQHYRVVAGEMFLMPCTNKKVTWSKIRVDGEGNGGFYFDCGREFLIEAKHSGNYTLLTGKMFLHLQVLEKQNLPCYKAEEVDVMLLAGAGGKIPCPGFNCTLSTGVTWYKGNKRVSEQHRASCEKNGQLHLCTVRQYDTARYFCDKHFEEQELQWTFRRPVHVTAIPYKEVSSSPRITIPDGNTTVEVELGEPHTLKCQVHFPFDVNFSPQVQWYMNSRDNMKNRTMLHNQSQEQDRVTFKELMVTRSAIIQEVTALHINRTYACTATNSFGNSSVTVKLKRKIKEERPSLVGYPIATLLLVAGIGIVLHVKWLELQLIYISRFRRGKVDGDEKEFDVFLSYVWAPPCEEAHLTLSSQSGQESLDYPSTLEPFNSEGVIGDLRPPEVLIPMVLEGRWGYRLCLLERDILPGGAYTNDVVRAIRRSHILICIVSAHYLSNSNAVFVLESGIQVMVQSSTLKILLIQTGTTSTSFVQLDSPLPSLVRRALKVLPSLDWKSGPTESATIQLWRSLRKALPKHRVTRVTGVISHAHFGQKSYE